MFGFWQENDFLCWWNHHSARYGLIDPDGVFPRPEQPWHLSPSYSMLGTSRRSIGGAIIDTVTLKSLEDHHRYTFLPLTFLLRNTRPVGHQVSNFLHRNNFDCNERIYENVHQILVIGILWEQWPTALHSRLVPHASKRSSVLTVPVRMNSENQWTQNHFFLFSVDVNQCTIFFLSKTSAFLFMYCYGVFAGVCRTSDFIIAVGGFEFNSIDAATILLHINGRHSHSGSSAAIDIPITKCSRPQCSVQPWPPPLCQPCSCLCPLEHHCNCEYGMHSKIL